MCSLFFQADYTFPDPYLSAIVLFCVFRWEEDYYCFFGPDFKSTWFICPPNTLLFNVYQVCVFHVSFWDFWKSLLPKLVAVSNTFYFYLTKINITCKM